MAGTLFVVATPIGNLEDITARALRVLREVELIAAEDTRRTSHLLTRYGITTRTTSLHEHNERGKSSALIARLEAGESIALVSDAGTPTVSDPGVHLISAAIEHGIRVEPVPGPNAAVAALSVSGLLTDSFTFLGFPPIKSKDRIEWFERLAKSGPTVVFYEAPHRIQITLEEIQHRMGDVPIIVARELTKAHEELVRGPISSVISRLSALRGEFTVVVDVGHSTDILADPESRPPSAEAISAEFGRLTINRARTRRQAISALSRRWGVSAKLIYSALEAVKKSGG